MCSKPLSAISAFLAMVAVTLLFAPPNANAHTPQSRKMSAIIQAIDYDKKIMDLKLGQTGSTKRIVWDSQTLFLCDGKTALPSDLKTGATVDVFYHSPLFGKPFAIKIIWASAPAKP